MTNQRIVELTQRSGHHLLVPSQCKRGSPLVKGFRGCGLAIRRKEVYFEVLVETSFGEMPCWDDILPKRGKYGWAHLMHAIGVGIERAFNPYPSEVRQKLREGEKQNKKFCLGMENGTTSTL